MYLALTFFLLKAWQLLAVHIVFLEAWFQFCDFAGANHNVRSTPMASILVLADFVCISVVEGVVS